MFYDFPHHIQVRYAHIFDEKENMLRVAQSNNLYKVGGFPSYIVKGMWDRYGFIDTSGNEIIAANYLFANDFSEGLALVETISFQNYFIDKTGQQVINLHGYDRAYSFCQGLACVVKGTKYGFIDKTGKLAIPLSFDHVFGRFEYQFNDAGNIAAAVNQKYGIIDTNGRFIIQPDYDIPRYTYDDTPGAIYINLYKSDKQLSLDKQANIIAEK
ncbi:MAG: WG repeat-containing protein [Chitinophagaceae bacterium]|nr:WG repeat-containing protein [Chitinophagaceae bacterium]